MQMDAEPSTKRLRSDGGDQDPKLLLDRIIASVRGKNLSNPQELVSLPFPSLGPAPPPARFNAEASTLAIRHFKYMGRTGYANFRNTVFGLQKMDSGDLPVRPDKKPTVVHDKAGLWGTMGSGKSFMLAALACDLLASFNQSSGGKKFQEQRAVYLPDCGLLLDGRAVLMKCFRKALSLSYAEDAEILGLIGELSDTASLRNFFYKEADKGVLIYLLVDQFNALDFSEDGPAQQDKDNVKHLLMDLSLDHFLVQSASASNANAKEWYRKQVNGPRIFHHGGLDVEEYKSWREHFSKPGGLPASWDQLTEEQELKVKDMTGCVPLFLQCWNRIGTTPANAWQEFCALPEIKAAHFLLTHFITLKLDCAGPLQLYRLLHIYFQFVTEGEVYAEPADEYDCRYLYVDTSSNIGRCVCGFYRKCIAEILQTHKNSAAARPGWQGAISREVSRPNPNLAILGFMVEQHIISEIMKNGISVPLYARQKVKCDKLVYFESGNKSCLPIDEGCTLYVPSAFNYHRVDAIIRMYDSRAEEKNIRPPVSLADSYSERRLHILGVQITLGRLEKHLGSESEFCSPKVMAVWWRNWDAQQVARWFIWFVLNLEIDEHKRDAAEVSPGCYERKEVKSTTWSGSIQEFDHLTIFKPLEQFEPCLKQIAKMKT